MFVIKSRNVKQKEGNKNYDADITDVNFLVNFYHLVSFVTIIYHLVFLPSIFIVCG